MMTPQELLMDLMVRAVLLAMPISVGVLAFRRLLMSQTTNVWLYAVTVGFAAFVAMGMMPWAMGLEPISTVFLLLTMVCPPVWLAIVVVCGIGRPAPYDVDVAEDVAAEPRRSDPLILTNPVQQPVPIFRHHRRQVQGQRVTAAEVVDVARAMRGRATSEARRVRKLLPPPSPEALDLPFLR